MPRPLCPSIQNGCDSPDVCIAAGACRYTGTIFGVPRYFPPSQLSRGMGPPPVASPQPSQRLISQGEVYTAAIALVRRAGLTSTSRIWGVPRGGVGAALAVAGLCRGIVVDSPGQADIVVDDIYDSGRTAACYAGKRFEVLFDKRLAPWTGVWLVMPWEVTAAGYDDSAEDAVVRLLQFIGEDPAREGLRETPARVIRAWAEWSAGYTTDIAGIFKTFEDGATDEMVIVSNIPVVSKCEHHLADICGMAHVGYIPNKRIVGLSKIPRLVEAFARRLQVQERMTAQVADAMVEHLAPKGVGVLIRAEHRCMSSRGVRVHGSVTTTSAMRGALLDKPEARAEFLALCRDAEMCPR
jgi:GTP cyclohydrolase IA